MPAHWHIFLKKTRTRIIAKSSRNTERIKMLHLFKRIIHLTSINIDQNIFCFLFFCSVITPFWNLIGFYLYLGFMFRVFVILVSIAHLQLIAGSDDQMISTAVSQMEWTNLLLLPWWVELKIYMMYDLYFYELMCCRS